MSILYEFGVEQGYIKPSFSLYNDIDFQLATNFQDVDSLADMK